MNIEILKQIRKEKKILIQELAQDLEVTRETMGGYESGKLDPKKSFLMKWAKELGCMIEIVKEVQS